MEPPLAATGPGTTEPILISPTAPDSSLSFPNAASLANSSTPDVTFLTTDAAVLTSSVAVAAAATAAAAQQQQQVVAAAATAVITQALIPALSSTVVLAEAVALAELQLETDALVPILERHCAELDDNDISCSLENLDRLQQAMQLSMTIGYTSPGFFTLCSPQTWTRHDDLLPDYETLQLPLQSQIPIPSPAFAAQCCALIRTIFQQRLAWKQGSLQSCCYCIAEWEFASGNQDKVLYTLVNQTLEQLMIQEASECISQHLLPDTAAIEAWNQTYAPETCPSTAALQHLYLPHTPVKLLRTRDDYINHMIKYCMAAKHTIQISTCYLFSHDPAQRYILLDVLPHIIQQRGVTVQVLLDLLTIESAIIKSGFKNKSKTTVEPRSVVQPDKENTHNITMTSFLQHLPDSAPAQTEESRKSCPSPLAFLQQLLQLAEQPNLAGRYQISWWCARDAEHHYRIKNHSKCTVIDHQVAIMGGSNLAPTLEAATSDLDVLMVGPAARQVAETMEMLWSAMGQPLVAPVTAASATCDPTEPTSSLLEELIQCENWTDADSQLALVRSLPSSKGEDAVLRVVLGAIAEAQESIFICMGHCNIPTSMARALRDTTERNVEVQILINSMYSCDLRVGQRDLFLSLRDLLALAPQVQVYVTAMHDTGRPPFLHAKYVIVDGKFTAVGSWNVWTRGSFYELEHEALIQSTAMAQELLGKFEEEKNAAAVRIMQETCDPGAGFCPIGCAICKGFGPFFSE